METAIETPSALDKRNGATRRYLPFLLPFFAVKIHRKEKAGKQTNKQKKRVKQKGSQAIFYSMTFLNKNIVQRSKVHFCTAVVWRSDTSFGRPESKACPSRLITLSVLGLIIGSVCKVADASAITMLVYRQSTYQSPKARYLSPYMYQVKNLLMQKQLVDKRPSYLFRESANRKISYDHKVLWYQAKRQQNRTDGGNESNRSHNKVK